MQKAIGVIVTLCGMTLGACGNLAGLSVGSTQPLRVSVVEHPAEPVIHYGGYSSPDDSSEFVDPVPRYLAQAGIRQAAANPPKTAKTALRQELTDPPKTAAADPLPSEVRVDPPLPEIAAADPLASEVRVDPPQTAAVEPTPSTRTEAPSLEELQKLRAQRYEEAVRAANERDAKSEREAERMLGSICNGC
jgi:hypothetical protein